MAKRSAIDIMRDMLDEEMLRRIAEAYNREHSKTEWMFNWGIDWIKHCFNGRDILIKFESGDHVAVCYEHGKPYMVHLGGMEYNNGPDGYCPDCYWGE